MEPAEAKQIALGLAVLCVRNTSIEDIHSGIEPATDAGDFSDVIVVTPHGEMSWNSVSRISNDEMRAFMIQVVDRLYTSLLRLNDPEFVARVTKYARGATSGWKEPQDLPDWFSGKWDAVERPTEADRS